MSFQKMRKEVSGVSNGCSLLDARGCLPSYKPTTVLLVSCQHVIKYIINWSINVLFRGSITRHVVDLVSVNQ